MAQSWQHLTQGDLRIPKNIPYNRARHIDWSKLSTIDSDSADDANDSQSEQTPDAVGDDTRVWTF
jgi:hypothetical protein